MALNLNIELLSDSLFGAGHGRAGEVDIEPELDPATGLPVIGGRTLKGLLVEAAADILYSAEQAGSPGLDRLRDSASRLFGRPGSDLKSRGALRVSTATMPADLHQAVLAAIGEGSGSISRKDVISREDVVEALTIIRRQTAIDTETDAPKKGSLRSGRLVMRGMELSAPITLEGEIHDDDLALLDACARSVRRAGSNRTRGMGHVRMQLNGGAGSGPSRKRFEAMLRGEAGPDLSPRRNYPDKDAQPPLSHDTSLTLRYRLHFEEPVLVAGLEGDPNSAVGLDRVPGTTLRGAFIGRYLRGRNGTDLAVDHEARRLFFDGDICFTDALPSPGPGEIAVPTPRSFHQKKGDKEAVSDFAVNPDLEIKPNTQWKRKGGGYAVIRSNSFTSLQPARRVSLHIQRSRRTTTAGSDDREVFRYDAIEAGEVYEGALVCANEEAARIAASWLTGEIRIGGTSTAGYGRCRIERVDFGRDEARVSEEEEVSIVLRSPMILRDHETGLFTTSTHAFEDQLSQAVGRQVEVIRTYAAEELVGGFNRKWGLPLPQVRALAPGSTFVVRGLNTSAIQPIGERTVEGFGEMIVRPLSNAAYEIQEARSDIQIAPTSVDEASRRALDRIANRTLERRIDRLVLATAINLTEKAKSIPTRSQLARSRQQFRHALESNKDATDSLTKFFKDLAQPARKALSSCRIDGTRLYLWLQERAAGNGDAASYIGLTEYHRPEFAEQRIELDAEQRRRIHWQLALTTLTLLAKKKSD